jgi:cytoplasmic iron level regulating protein YaaA (DUF328/UPF0246 family)
MTKSPAPDGDPVDLRELSFPELSRHRVAVLEAGATPGVRVAPTTPARELYGGNLLKMALDGLSAEALQRADEQVVYVSGLWGAVRPTDELPDYRVHMCERPEGLGHLVQYWQEPLESVLPAAAGSGLIVDLRSAEYLLAWRPRGELADRWVGLKAVRDDSFERGCDSATSRTVRGRVLHRILSEGIDATDPDGLAAALTPHFRVQLRPPTDHLNPWELRVVQPG